MMSFEANKIMFHLSQYTDWHDNFVATFLFKIILLPVDEIAVITYSSNIA